MKKRFQIGLILLVVLLAACSTPTQRVPEVTVIIETDDNQSPYPVEGQQDNGYPAPGGDTGPGYPAPGGEDAPILPELDPGTPDPDLGIVHGVLLLKGAPVTAAILYLSDLIEDGQGNQAVTFNRKNQARAFSDQEGRFEIINVRPGTYGLVLDTIHDAYLLHYPGADPILVSVQAGDRLDLGELDYQELPFQP